MEWATGWEKLRIGAVGSVSAGSSEYADAQTVCCGDTEQAAYLDFGATSQRLVPNRVQHAGNE